MTRIIAKSPAPGPFGRSPVPFPFGDARTHLTANGRTAIWAGLRALGLRGGARVLVPAWHCGSEVDAILAAGGRPVPYRLGRDLSADLDDVARLLRAGGGAIHVIHYFGREQPLAALADLAGAAGALLVEDLALGLYSRGADGAPLGRAGDMAVFSLVKTLGVPDGGALWMRRDAVLPALGRPPLRHTLAALKSLSANALRRRVRSGPRDRGGADLDRWDAVAGFGDEARRDHASRITRFMLGHVDHERVAAVRRRNYRALAARLPAMPALRPLIEVLPAGACPAYFPLWTAEPDRVFAALARAGIEPVRFWRRFHPAIDLSGFPEAAALKRHVLRLPIHEGVTEPAIARMVRACTSA